MILQELKKILGIKRVLMLAAFALLYYLLFFRMNVGIPENSSENVKLEVSLELLEKYGRDMDEKEYRDFSQSMLFPEESRIDAWIKGQAEYKQYGIESYRDWIEMGSQLPNEVAASLSSQTQVGFTIEEQQEAMEIAFRGISADSLVKAYDREVKADQGTAYYAELPEGAEKRIAQRKEEEVYSLMPDGVMRNYLKIVPDFTIFLFLSVIFLIVPYSVKDTMEGVPVLQYTSRKGCRYYWKKLAAVFIGAWILCVIEMVWLALMLRINHTFAFWECFVSGFWNPFITFAKLTFGQYIMGSLAYIGVIALCLAMVTYCLSSCARNYVSAIAFQIPAIIFSFLISFGLMPDFAEISQSWILLCLILGSCFLTAAMGNVVRFFSIKYYEKF